MQQRSRAYQAVLYFTRRNEHGINFYDLLFLVADFVDPERAKRYRLSRLKKAPSETDAETISQGQIDIARKYIDQAHRQGLINYIDEETDAGHNQRTVLWSRPARTGGPYGTSEANREAEENASFHRYLLSRNP